MAQLTIQHTFDLALQYHQAGRLQEAERLYRQILTQQPEHAVAMHHLGLIAYQTGRNDVAIDLIRRAIALDPNSSGAHSNLGSALKGKGQLDEAIAAYRRAIALNPNLSEAHNNLGNALKDKGQLDEAIAAFRQAIAVNPNLPEAHNNLGIVLRDTGHIDEAIAAYRRAIMIKPDDARVHWNLAILLLSMARFAEGWEEFEWRLKDATKRLRRDFGAPQWNGEDLSGKTLLTHTEGGYGDAFHFIRYVPLLRGRAKKMILECDSSLVGLFSNLPGVDQIIARGQTLPAFDYHIPLQSLPRLFKTDLTNIPNAVPYLHVPLENRSHCKERVQNDGRLKVGLVWAGSAKPRDDRRTRGLDVFAPLGQTPGVRFFSLQKGPESSLARPPGLELVDFTDDLNDFMDSAALIENLDLVISVDTSVAHLAGALAKPVWVLIPFSADFRWLMDRTDSPWYPTMRLFRQKRRGDWTSVGAEVAAALKTVRFDGSTAIP
jgi:Tfp pilus assembly protein PilF